MIPTSRYFLVSPLANTSRILDLSFEDNAGTTATDLSGNGNTGTLSGSTIPTWTTGKYGYGLSFNGSTAYVDEGNGTALNFNTADFTIEFWGYDYKTTASDSTFISKGYGQAGYNGNFIIRSHHTIGMEFNAFNGVVVIFTMSYTGYATARNAWHHIAVRRASGLIQLYVDGALQTWTISNGSDTYAGNLGYNNYNMYMGKNPSNDNEYLNGFIDEFRIYNRALSLKEINLCMNNRRFIQLKHQK